MKKVNKLNLAIIAGFNTPKEVRELLNMLNSNFPSKKLNVVTNSSIAHETAIESGHSSIMEITETINLLMEIGEVDILTVLEGFEVASSVRVHKCTLDLSSKIKYVYMFNSNATYSLGVKPIRDYLVSLGGIYAEVSLPDCVLSVQRS